MALRRHTPVQRRKIRAKARPKKSKARPAGKTKRTK